MICTIFATDQMGTFGNRGTLPWPMDAEDMAWFREHTIDQIVVMGRKTWDDPKMKKPLSIDTYAHTITLVLPIF